MEQTINLQQGTKIEVCQVNGQHEAIKYRGVFMGFINMGNIIFISFDGYTLGVDKKEKSILLPLHSVLSMEYEKSEIVILKPRLQI